MRRSDRFVPYRLIAPALLIEAGLVLAPLAIGFYYSLHNVRFFRNRGFVGADNYWRLLESDAVANALIVTATFTVASLLLTFALGFALALHLERDSRLHVFMRAVVLVPYMIAMLVGSMLLKWVFAQESGLMPLMLGPFGLGGSSILADPNSAMAALVFNAMWRDSAFAMIMLLAGRSIVNSFKSETSTSTGLEYRRTFTPNIEGSVILMNEGKVDAAERKGVSAQVWLLRPFTERTVLEMGFGAYAMRDQLDRTDPHAERENHVAPIASIGMRYRFDDHWRAQLTWSRVITNYERDSDVFLLGAGYAF